MVRVGYIGNFEPPYSTENDVRKAFEHLGHEVIQLQENAPDTLDRLYQLVEAKAIDLLLFTSTWDEAIPLDAAQDIMYHCAYKGIKTATYHLDVFWGSDRGERKWWRNPMFRTGHVFTASNDWQEEWRNMGVNHQWLRPAVRHDAVGIGTKRPEYECDVAFVGSNGVGYHEGAWSYRKELVDFLRDMCKRNSWSWKNPGGDDPKVDRNQDRNDFYASAKVTVGDSLCLKREQSEYCSDRAYEAPGCGGLLIMPRLTFLNVDYEGKLPMYSWDNFEELEDMVRFYLDNPTVREATQQDCMKIVERDHTYVNRAQTILEEVGLV